jgi:L-iditol 2-dehydrogenase
MEMRDVPDLHLQHPTDVKIRMEAVGVCGSDIHYYVSGRIGSQVVKYPFTVGHECAGTVVETGSSVRDVSVGERVAVEPAITCGSCDQCKAGRNNTCRNGRFLGCPGQAEGSLSEFIVMPEENCFSIRDGTSFGEATLSEPLAIGVYAIKNSIPLAGASVGILGMGPIGTCVLLPAQTMGPAGVYCTDRIDARVELARANGATWAGNPDQEDVLAAIREREPNGLDVVFECCGRQDAVDQCIEILKPGGKLMMIGIPEVDRITFQIDQMRRKEITIYNVRRQEGCVQDALDLIEQDKIDAGSMVTHRFPFAASREAFELVAGYGDGVLKAMIEFGS